MTIYWSKAPEGATHYVAGSKPNWFKETDRLSNYYWWNDGGGWEKSNHIDITATYGEGYEVTPRPAEPKPYTRDEALQFLVERLDSWPTDIADAPLCPGWGWVRARVDDGCVFVHRANVELESPIHHHQWQVARPDFVPFVSVEDAQPATAKQPAPSGKGDPILGMVLADLTNRALEGREKYGEALKANNGRNALWDAYQEALDLAMYLRQAIEEQSRAQTDR